MTKISRLKPRCVSSLETHSVLENLFSDTSRGKSHGTATALPGSKRTPPTPRPPSGEGREQEDMPLRPQVTPAGPQLRRCYWGSAAAEKLRSARIGHFALSVLSCHLPRRETLERRAHGGGLRRGRREAVAAPGRGGGDSSGRGGRGRAATQHPAPGSAAGASEPRRRVSQGNTLPFASLQLCPSARFPAAASVAIERIKK